MRVSGSTPLITNRVVSSSGHFSGPRINYNLLFGINAVDGLWSRCKTLREEINRPCPSINPGIRAVIDIFVGAAHPVTSLCDALIQHKNTAMSSRKRAEQYSQHWGHSANLDDYRPHLIFVITTSVPVTSDKGNSMTTRRFTLPVLLALMSLPFSVPSYANDLVSATGTISCTDYSLSISAANLRVGRQYTIDYTFTIESSSAPSTVISNSKTFIATSSSQTVSVPVTAVGPLAGTITVTLASATLTSSGSSVPIVFTSSPSPLVCTTATGRFTGGGRRIEVSGLSITAGLELDCDLMPPNNLEINWAGNRFHLKTLKSATCLLVGNPTPPVAPINEMIAKGTGRYNGADGYSVSFTLIDNGEPGRRDMLAFLIYETANPSNVVLSLPLQLLTNGNLQAHFDQR